MKRFFSLLSASFLLSLGFAFAHSELESSTPEDGATLTEAPTQIVLNFKSDVQTGFSIFKVYPLSADMIVEASATAESGDHAEGEAHSEGEEPSSETTSSETSEHSEGTEGEHSEDEETEASHDDSATDEHSEEGEHGESGEHGAMDAAAKVFIPTVIDLQDDEAARLDTGIVETGTSKTVTINLKKDLAPGAYVAMFRILSDDTHTVEGFITFEITE
jgi:methionine-rich copper-binding protein CopC